MPGPTNRQHTATATGSVQFLSGRSVWTELKRRSAKANSKVHAAVAYFGKDGAKLLTLKAGDRLLVDMSLLAVRQGVTDPREIEKLMRKKVQVFTRSGLHAKFYLMDGVLICGSANVSSRSELLLDEAAILTNDKGAIHKAKAYLNEMCSEPVTEPYLEKCLKEYQPPWFTAARGGGKIKASGASKRAKVWFVGGLSRIEIPDADKKKVEEIEKELGKDIDEGHEVAFIRYRKKPGYYDSIKPQNWVVSCVREADGHRCIDGPSQVLRKRTYRSARGTDYHMLMLSSPVNGDSMSFTQFKTKVKAIIPDLVKPRAKSRPIVDPAAGDALLRLWTSTGKIKGGRRD